MDNLIFHIDVNSAFLSWEAVYRLHIRGEKTDLRDIPSAVGGDIKKRHGIILARSTPAKKYGVRTGDTISDALKLCPNLVLVDPHYDLYESCSEAFMEILREFSPCVEQYSVDEAFCDMTGTVGLYGSAVVAATLMKDKIYNELGFTVNVGISTNKILAKMASDFKKPNLVHTLFPSEIEKMWRLPVGDLFFVGPATKRKLHALGIHTIRELAGTDLDILRAHFKKHGELIYSFANGIDVSLVTEEAPPNKGYGNSTTIAFDVDDGSTAKMVLLSLAEKVCARLRADSAMATVVAVSIVDTYFRHESHQMQLFSPSNITNEIHRASSRLFDKLWDGSPIRQLGIHTSKIVRGDVNPKQINLFDMNRYEKLSKLDVAVDMIRERYGEDSLVRAVFLDGPIYHMSGGISPEKRKAKYKEGIKDL